MYIWRLEVLCCQACWICSIFAFMFITLGIYVISLMSKFHDYYYFICLVCLYGYMYSGSRKGMSCNLA
jgi:hypothetical protein